MNSFAQASHPDTTYGPRLFGFPIHVTPKLSYHGQALLMTCLCDHHPLQLTFQVHQRPIMLALKHCASAGRTSGDRVMLKREMKMPQG